MNYIKERTPLWYAYFSGDNIQTVQNGIKSKVKSATGYNIDDQNESDLLAMMGKVFTNYSRGNESGSTIGQQVRLMNDVIIQEASAQVISGVRQQMYFLQDRAQGLQIMDQPINTSTYGKKINSSDPRVFNI